MYRHLLAATALLAVLVLAAACGSDGGDSSSEASATTDGTSTASAITAPTAEAPEPGGSTRTATACTESQAPMPGGDYRVDLIDSQLRVRTDAGTANDVAFTLESGSAAPFVSGPQGCAIASDDSVWWLLAIEESVNGYVDSSFIVRDDGLSTGSQATEICSLYDEVLSYETGPGDFAPRTLTEQLDTALDQPPGGVSDALERISSPANDEDLFLAYESLKSYVGPICAQP